MTQKFKLFKSAVRLARAIGYLTQEAVEIKISIEGWEVNTDVGFQAALFALNLFDSPPAEPPDWWEEEAEYFLVAVDKWNELSIWQEAEKLFYERTSGEVPQFTGKPNAQAVKCIEDWLAEQSRDEERHELMASDPNYREDVRHAKRVAQLNDMADASDSPEEFQSLVNDWDEFIESKRSY